MIIDEEYVKSGKKRPKPLKVKVFLGTGIKEVEEQCCKFLAKNENIEIKQCMTTETQHGRRLMFCMTVLYNFEKNGKKTD